VARIIEFHVPPKFLRKETSFPQSQKGKLIEFWNGPKKSA